MNLQRSINKSTSIDKQQLLYIHTNYRTQHSRLYGLKTSCGNRNTLTINNDVCSRFIWSRQSKLFFNVHILSLFCCFFIYLVYIQVLYKLVSAVFLFPRNGRTFCFLTAELVFKNINFINYFNNPSVCVLNHYTILLYHDVDYTSVYRYKYHTWRQLELFIM